MARTVSVTGGDRGLGFALCAGLLEQGWQVFAGQYMPEWPDLSTLAGQCPQTLHILPLDVSSVESTRAAAEAVAVIADHVDVLIDNAGVHSPTDARSVNR
jgi:NAD(P)-dependent dehydrogenase (short-subunit alcohol dehydrogenase family)